MKLSERWLREWINPEISQDELVHQLTMAGLEVDSVEPVAADFDHVVIGLVLSAEPHPDADRLRVCQVDVGAKAPLSIVCGGANVRKDLKVPVAMIGATLPGGMKIKKTKLRGADSEGMICSASELGLTDTSQGIHELSSDAPIGEDVRQYLHLNDHSIAIDLTPNRGDCLSVLGVAREVAALNALPFTEKTFPSIKAADKSTLNINLAAPEACSRYVGRVIRGVNVKTESPVWLQEALRRSGLRTISPVVDVTNYVMLELGQPMHAFDLAKVSGEITVRFAHKNEKLVLLDSTECALNENALVIADEKNTLALAGIMGGLTSGVTDETTDVFLESAYFAPETIARSVRHYSLHSDSSHRFERGVDSALQEKAIERATGLLIEIVGGKPGPITIASDDKQTPKMAVITLRPNRVNAILALSLSEKEIADMLTSLGMTICKKGEALEVCVPTYRSDISLEEDLIEEVARLYGYDKLPVEKGQGTIQAAGLKPMQALTREYRSVLKAREYHEAINYSFVDPKIQTLLFPDASTIDLLNPISPELSQMRLSLWPSLVTALMQNQRRQQERVRLFEVGHCFHPIKDGVLEYPLVAGIASGTLFAEQWGAKACALDFYDVKADVEALLRLMTPGKELTVSPSDNVALHPGQSAVISQDKEDITWLGALHPRIVQQLDLQGPVFLFELRLDLISTTFKPTFNAVSKFQMNRRDISFLVDANVSAQSLIECVRTQSNELVQDIQIFDVYQGGNIPEGQKSIAMSIMLQDPSRTLVDDEMNSLIEKIISTLQKVHKIHMRQ